MCTLKHAHVLSHTNTQTHTHHLNSIIFQTLSLGYHHFGGGSGTSKGFNIWVLGNTIQSMATNSHPLPWNVPPKITDNIYGRILTVGWGGVYPGIQVFSILLNVREKPWFFGLSRMGFGGSLLPLMSIQAFLKLWALFSWSSLLLWQFLLLELCPPSATIASARSVACQPRSDVFPACGVTMITFQALPFPLLALGASQIPPSDPASL